MAELIQKLRGRLYKEIGGYVVEKIVDYQNAPTMYSVFSCAMARPSDTETERKVYLTALEESETEYKKTVTRLVGYFEDRIEMT